MKSLLAPLLAIVLGFVLHCSLFPPKRPLPVIPNVVTHYDTVRALPKWFEDSLKNWKKLSKPIETVVTSVVVESFPVYVPNEQAEAPIPEIYPILRYHGGSQFGDSFLVHSFSLKRGNQVVSTGIVTGILTDIHSDSASSKPILTFETFPAKQNTPFIQKLKFAGLGGAVVLTLACILNCFK